MEKLNKIRLEIEKHPSNAWARKLGYKPVFTASEKAKIVIVGQAPGKKAQETRIPWNDISGDRLRNWLDIDKKIFYDDTKIALIPMDFYYPGKGKNGDLPPRKDFAPTWHKKIINNIKEVRLTILAGQFAQKYYLDKQQKKNLTETVRSYNDYLPDFFPIVHPSPLNIRWLSKNKWFEQDIVPRLKQTVQKIIKDS